MSNPSKSFLDQTSGKYDDLWDPLWEPQWPKGKSKEDKENKMEFFASMKEE